MKNLSEYVDEHSVRVKLPVSKRELKRLLIAVVVALLVGMVVMSLISWAWNVKHPPKPEVIVQTVDREIEKKTIVDSQFISDKLSDIGELSTLEIQYMKKMTVEDEDGIAFINKTGYAMIYTIEARVGIKFDDIKIAVSDSEVTVTLPKAEVLERHADGKSLEFYDEKWALFKSNTMNDVPTAVALAESDFDEQTDAINTYLEIAQQRAELSVRNLLEGVIGDKRLVIE